MKYIRIKKYIYEFSWKTPESVKKVVPTFVLQGRALQIPLYFLALFHFDTSKTNKKKNEKKKISTVNTFFKKRYHVSIYHRWVYNFVQLGKPIPTDKMIPYMHIAVWARLLNSIIFLQRKLSDLQYYLFL